MQKKHKNILKRLGIIMGIVIATGIVAFIVHIGIIVFAMTIGSGKDDIAIFYGRRKSNIAKNGCR
ncbi:hypothetical protein ACFSTH_13250 [Paenibacillus yanchengensis]|uniref:DUF2273 domain-containing protein n=1 Tax=Paenibacillus yanchengensis TaxID=2035833 RepID=A0ABW4YNA9_9BACL